MTLAVCSRMVTHAPQKALGGSPSRTRTEPKIGVAHLIESANPLKMVAAANACADSQIEILVPEGGCGEAASLPFS
jgi:hypothetical protein